jgi:sec-independent protein translocase protein TatC
MLLKYFLEIKARGILILICWTISLLTAYLNKEVILFLCVLPTLPLFLDNSFYFIATNITDIFATYLTLSYLIAFQLTIFFLFYQALMFLTPALYSLEKKILKRILYSSFIFWLISIQMLTSIILPLTWSFFLSFQDTSKDVLNIFLETRINEYLTLYVFIYWVVVLVWQFFLSFFLILNSFNKKLEFIKNTRKFVYFVFFVFATLLTPPDVISQLLLAFCFGIVYELMIITTILKIMD